MTRWLVTGSYGQLGTDLQEVLRADGAAEVRAVDVDVLDITDSAAVNAVVDEFRPDVLVNAAAFTAVDAAEEQEELAYRVNATGPAVLAAALAKSGSGRLVHVSTDYVFAGDGTQPYEVDDEPAPRSAYGRTKLAGEQAVREVLPDASYVVRTAWVYGGTGANFVKTMAKLERERDTISVVDDQRGSPTWSMDLAKALVELANSTAPAGIYHCTGSGDTTWFGFTQAIFEELGADPSRVLPTTTDAFPRPAPRPAYSVLSDRAWRNADLTPMPHWRDALRTAFETVGEQLRAG
ncbi:MAG TPA: dTDP-4-dehydrorhamnose reductase [Jatrophihabitantaceae bacterium]|nr:dTDP-4-dehydrorhamnose reductase [Jatrophihabitantaceae bacterium]